MKVHVVTAARVMSDDCSIRGLGRLCGGEGDGGGKVMWWGRVPKIRADSTYAEQNWTKQVQNGGVTATKSATAEITAKSTYVFTAGITYVRN